MLLRGAYRQDDESVRVIRTHRHRKDGPMRIHPATGCERFAEYLYKIINEFLAKETEGRVKAIKVEVYEHERNSASYEER